MINILAVGTLKRGFPLHDKGLPNARYLGAYRTVQPFPMIIAGEWYAPMILNQPGTGYRLMGELYELSADDLPLLDALESVGKPGNFRITVDADPIGKGQRRWAALFVKAPEIALPVHSGYIEDYQDWRFIPPDRRRGII